MYLGPGVTIAVNQIKLGKKKMFGCTCHFPTQKITSSIFTYIVCILIHSYKVKLCVLSQSK